jgi:hypothetical protein
MIILTCVAEGSKLRIKFHSFINDKNEIYRNVYNNDYNCMFPKDIRKVGLYYRIGDRDISLSGGTTSKKPFYTIKRQNITIMTEQEVSTWITKPLVTTTVGLPIKIFDAGECVICLSSESSILFLPCAHRCTCTACHSSLKASSSYNCPVCRQSIMKILLE